MEIKIESKLQFDELNLLRILKKRNSVFVKVVQDVFEESHDALDHRITPIFPNYTLHDTQHSFRIINYMEKLVEDVNLLSDLEITLLICSALLHDVGMAIDSEDLKAIKNDAFIMCEEKYSTMLKLMKGNETEATQEYIRRIHSQLSARFVRNKLKDKLVVPDFPNLDFSEELALICESHTMDYDWIKSHLNSRDVRGNYDFNAQFIACILRIADILDIDGNRTPYKLYQLISPEGRSDNEWLQHFVITNNEKIICNDRLRQKEIVFHGKSKNADIHRKLLNYIDWIGYELTESISLLSTMQNKYNLIMHERPKVHIQTEGYTFAGYKMTLKFDAISSLLMGEKIYGSKSLGLRELIQNSIDACRIRQESERSEFGEDPYQPKIRVIIDQENQSVIIKDNGIGMTVDVIKNHFLNIGVSYYTSYEFLLKDLDYKPIGNYGIGFLSCFMLSEKVTVNTRYFRSKDKYSIKLEKGNEWTSLTKSTDVAFDGTEVILNFTEFMEVFDNKMVEVEKFLTHYFLTDGVDFKFVQKPVKVIPIVNLIDYSKDLHPGHFKISFANLLNDIEGYAILKNKEPFVTNLQQILPNDKIYMLVPGFDYDEDVDEADRNLEKCDYFSLEPIENSIELKIDEYILENEVKYLSIPLVSSSLEEEFSNGLSFTGGDVKEVIDKLENKLNWITVLVPKELIDKFVDEEIADDFLGLNKISFDDLCEIGHDRNCPTYIYTRTIKLFEGRKNELYLPFGEGKPWHYFAFGKEPRKDLYIRNVLIKDFRFSTPMIASIFEEIELVINIKSKKYIPDVSRNNVDTRSQNQINYIVGKAIHQGAIASMNFSEYERNTLLSFIDEFYKETTAFEKN